MASETEIANAACTKLGVARITSLSDNVERARVLNSRYADVRDAELRRNRWRFALARANLPALSATPEFGFTYKYQKPDQYLSLVQIGSYDLGPDLTDYRSAPTGLFSVEADEILTDLAAPLPVRYVKRITDVSLMDPAFREALASRLAYECCERLTGSTNKQTAALRDYVLSIKEAKRANAIELAVEYPTDDTWVAVRSA